MNEEKVLQTINDYTKSIWLAKPSEYLDNKYKYYRIVIEELMDFIEKYKAYNYIGFDMKSVEKLLKYDKDDFRKEVSQNLSYLIEINIRSFGVYYNGMEISRDPVKKALYKEISKEAIQDVMDDVMDLVIRAFNKQFMEESLYFFLMVEKYGAKPTKALYERFMDIYISGTISSFIRELRINQILAPKKRVRKAK